MAELITVVMPVLNEADYVVAALESLTRQSSDCVFEILVMDGGSVDRTRQLVGDYAARDPRIKLFDNPQKVQSAAVNLAAELAHADSRILVRADCHALYPPGFVEIAAQVLRQKACWSVVVPMVTVGRGGFQTAAAWAQNSVLGNGGAWHRRQGPSCYVDHGHHAAFDRAAFLSLGGYDEDSSPNEDAELDWRIWMAGGKIWLESSIPVTYFPRSDVISLGRQYFNHGAGRAKTVLKHGMPLKLRQLAPVGVLVTTGLAMVLALFFPAFLGVPLVYAGVCLGWGGLAALQTRKWCLLGMGVAAMVMHFAWASGFVWRILVRPSGNRKGRARQ